MYPYILDFKENNLFNAINNLATKYEYVTMRVPESAYLVDGLDEEPITFPVYLYMEEYKYVSEDGFLSDRGKQFYYLRNILADIDSSAAMIKNDLLNNSLVNLMFQVFLGRGKINLPQLCNLFNFHNISSTALTDKDLTGFLILLNKYSIVTYDKKNRVFTMNDCLPQQHDYQEYYVEPATPYSNIYNMRKSIRTCRGDIFWIDKHFRKEGLELILDGLSPGGVTSITIISGLDNLTDSAKNDYHNLKIELANRDILLSWRTIKNKDFKWHDRWIISDSTSYNIPPVLALIRGQRSEIIQIKDAIDVTPFMQNSALVD